MEIFPVEAHQVITVLDQVFEHEAVTRDQAMTPAERLVYHQAHSGPLLEGLHDWLEPQFQDRTVEPNSSMGKAFRYLQNHWQTLTQFLRVEGAPLDSNTVERALKVIIRQRKNSLFYASPHSAQVASILTSLIATCVQAGVNALDYLVALQTHRPAVFRQPAAWLPWNFHEALAPA
jgi:hypothetical protein